MAKMGDLESGFEEMQGVRLGYLVIEGKQMFALSQVFTDLLKNIPRTTVHKRMDHLNVKKHQCDVEELRRLKAINSVAFRAAKCTLISREDVEALYVSCKSAQRQSARTSGRRNTKSHAPSLRDARYTLWTRQVWLSLHGVSHEFPCRRKEVPSQAACHLPQYYSRLVGRSCQTALKSTCRGFKSYEATPGPGGRLAFGARRRRKRDECNQVWFVPSRVSAKVPKLSVGTLQMGQELYLHQQHAGSLAQESGSSDTDSERGVADTDSDFGSGCSATSSNSGSSDEEEEEGEDEEDDYSLSESSDDSSSSDSASSISSQVSQQSIRFRRTSFQNTPPSKSESPLFTHCSLSINKPHLSSPKRFQTCSLASAWDAGTVPGPPASGPSTSSPFGEANKEAATQRVLRQANNCPQDLVSNCAWDKETTDNPSLGTNFRKDPKPNRIIKAEDEEEAAPSQPTVKIKVEPYEQPELSPSPFGGDVHGTHWCDAQEVEYKNGSRLRRNFRTLVLGKKSADPKTNPKLCVKSDRGKGEPQDGSGGCRRRRVSTPVAAAKRAFSLSANFPAPPSLRIGPDGDLSPAYSLKSATGAAAPGGSHPVWKWQLGGSVVPLPPSHKFRKF